MQNINEYYNFIHPFLDQKSQKKENLKSTDCILTQNTLINVLIRSFEKLHSSSSDLERKKKQKL